jgi:transglutaminase-like putative cysteine protease
VDYRRFAPRAIPYRGTEQTIAEMRRLALAAQTVWPLRRLVERVCRGLEAKDYLSELAALYHFVCQHVRYQRDPLTVELVKTPMATLQTGVGDCDDIATLLAALVLLSGSDARFVTVGFRRHGPFTHVFCEALDPRTKRWVTLDPVAGPHASQMLRRIRELKVHVVDV